MLGRNVLIGSPAFVRAHALPGRAALEADIAQLDGTLTRVLVAVDGVVVAAAAIGDRIRSEALVSLSALRAHQWRTSIASGDAMEVAQAVGATLGFGAHDVHANMTPEAKRDLVLSLRTPGRRVVMVGDGVNDAAAIAAASVGIGVHGGAEACLENADVFLARPGLTPLLALVEGAQRTVGVIRRNFVFSLSYNVIGALLAIMELLTPCMAALLMPLRSLTVVLASWQGRTFELAETSGSRKTLARFASNVARLSNAS